MEFTYLNVLKGMVPVLPIDNPIHNMTLFQSQLDLLSQSSIANGRLSVNKCSPGQVTGLSSDVITLCVWEQTKL